MNAEKRKPLSRRTFLKGVGLTTAGLALASCTPATQAPTTAPLATAAPPTAAEVSGKLTVWVWTDQERIKEAFVQKYPKVEVELVKMGPWDLHDKLLASFVAGAGAPDLSNLVNRRFTMYSSTGALVDLTDRAAPYQGLFSDFLWKLHSYDGKVYGLPKDTGPGLLFYRRDMFEAAGISVDELVTWDDYVRFGKELSTDALKMMPIFIPSGTWGANPFSMFLQSRGGNIFTPEGQVIENNELAVENLKFYTDLLTTHGIAASAAPGSPELWAAFKNNSLASWPMNVLDSASLKKNVPEQAGLWGIRPWLLWTPDAPAYTGNWGGVTMCIPKQSKNVEAAWKWIEFVATDEAGALASWDDASSWPANQEMQQKLPAEPVASIPNFFGGDSMPESIFARQLPEFYYYNWAEAEAIIGEAIDAVALNGEDVGAAWANAEERLKGITG
jgi:lactose/L-arabinose transport system substrate-binding protein